MRLSSPRTPRSLLLALWFALWISGGATTLSAQAPGSFEIGGATLPGDSIVFVLDWTVSMPASGALAEQVSVVEAALLDLDPAQSFSLVAFSSFNTVMSTTLLPATPADIANAIGFLGFLAPGGETGPAPAVVVALDIVSGAVNPAVVLISDITPTPLFASQQLQGITAANLNQVPIHTLQLTSVSDPSTVSFLTDVATSNGGTFTVAAPPSPTEFLRGDANGDGSVNVGDAITILQIGFGLSTAPTCLLAHDTNADGTVTPIADAITLLDLLFVPGTPPIAAPYPTCGAWPVPLPPNATCDVNGCP